MGFPKNFAWGAATAAYQIEGGYNADGKGPSVWDDFVQQKGKIWNGQHGQVACDHYHRWQEDVELMAEIGLKAYRLSLSWSRILPEGTGPVNEAGLAFYDKLVDHLLERGIVPWITLFHWDLPLAIHRKGGWLNPSITDWFADYAKVAVDRLSDRVGHWFTINEPQVLLDHGYLTGRHAPGDKVGFGSVLQMGHHILLSHGKATGVIKSRSRRRPRCGWAPVGSAANAFSESEADVQAAREATFSVSTKNMSVWNTAWWADPVYLGKYPEEAYEGYGPLAPRINPGDMELIHTDPDFYGANIYTSTRVRAGSDGTPEWIPHPDGVPLNTYDWAITPNSIRWAGKFFYERYKKPIVITENGIPIVEWVGRNGRVRDPQRSEYISTYLLGMAKAMDEGIPFEGYFYWSLMDNFEWQWGYKQRFGLIHVDYEFGVRTLKDSAYHYRKIIESNGAYIHEMV